MKKWKIIIPIILIILIQLVSATKCEISTNNITFSEVNNNGTYDGFVDETNEICSIQNLNCSTTYYIRAKNSSTGWKYSSITTEDCGEDEPMAALSITLFVMAIIGALYILPFKVKSFTNHPVTDFIIKRGCWSLATALLLMGTAMVATIADTAGIGLTNELFRIMWIIGRALWIILIWLVFGTLIQTVEYWKKQVKERKTGNE